MPEGDTLYRTAAVLRRALAGDVITAARGRAGGAQLERVVGHEVDAVPTRGKHLLIDFGNGLTLHTHLQMHGSWHRYRPGERWRVDPAAAMAVLETTKTLAVCFDAPTVELIESRALGLHPVLSQLGPDLLDDDFELDAAVDRLRAPRARGGTVAEALLDQRVAAGIGNVYRSEILFIERFDPSTLAMTVARRDAGRLLRTARGLLRANVGGW